MIGIESNDSYADREYAAQLRRHFLAKERERRILASEDVSIEALQDWALKNIYNNGSLLEQ